MIWTLADGLSDRVRHTVFRIVRKTTFAILQFKNTNVLHWKDFKPACFTDASSAMKSVRGHTLLKSNVEVVSKQAAKYSYECSDIAPFDWNTVCLWFQPGKDQERNSKGHLFQGGREERGHVS